MRSWSWFGWRLGRSVVFAAVVVAAGLIAMPQAASAQGEPTVTAVSPSVGPSIGGTSVTITGTNFLDPDSLVVYFGSNTSPDYDVVSSTEITATAPENTSGGTESLTVDVTVKTPYGTSATSSADDFTYSPNPTATPDPASAVSTTAATLNGTINPEGWDVTGCKFAWGQVQATGGVSFTYTPCAQTTPITGTSSVPVSLNLTGLTPDATYDYFVYVQYYCDETGPCAISSSQDSFIAAPLPTVTEVSPSSGPAAGGTSVTITGTNFTGATGVGFGSNAATNVTVVNSTTITATAPASTGLAHQNGTATVDVTVTTQAGTSATGAADEYTYYGVPSVTAVSPSVGPTAGGTAVTITGSHFVSGATVAFGGNPATNVTVVSSGSITATAPAGSAGTVDVTVTTPGGTSATSAADQYTYDAVPTVTQVAPSAGPTAGGTSVTITGTNLTGATAVKFGGTNATSFTVNSATSISATAPAESAGTVDITVTTAGRAPRVRRTSTPTPPSPRSRRSRHPRDQPPAGHPSRSPGLASATPPR
jgi:hypothetical protein